MYNATFTYIFSFQKGKNILVDEYEAPTKQFFIK